MTIQVLQQVIGVALLGMAVLGLYYALVIHPQSGIWREAARRSGFASEPRLAAGLGKSLRQAGVQKVQCRK